MEWLQNLLNGENGMAVQLVLITLALVLLLIVVFWIFRKITGAAAPKSTKNRVPRLSVTDSSRVDETRYLVLVRRDNVEHLVMIGGPSDIVIESNIVRIPEVKAANKPAQPTIAASQEIPAAPATPVATKPEPAPAPVAAVATGATATAAVVADKISPASNPELQAKPAEPVAEASIEVSKQEASVITPEPIEAEVASIEDQINLDTLQTELSENVANASSTDDLKDTITAELDSALSQEPSQSEIPAVTQSELAESASTPEIDSPSISSTSQNNEVKDDMQKLLDELSGIKKEPAQ